MGFEDVRALYEEVLEHERALREMSELAQKKRGEWERELAKMGARPRGATVKEVKRPVIKEKPKRRILQPLFHCAVMAISSAALLLSLLNAANATTIPTAVWAITIIVGALGLTCVLLFVLGVVAWVYYRTTASGNYRELPVTPGNWSDAMLDTEIPISTAKPEPFKRSISGDPDLDEKLEKIRDGITEDEWIKTNLPPY